jgi:Nif-specific regulatory protein
LNSNNAIVPSDLSKEMFESLFDISNILNSAVFEESLIEDALDYVIRIIHADRGLFVKYNEERNDFSIISARRMSKESITDISQFSSGVLQQILAKKQPVLYYDAQSDPNISQFTSVFIKNIKSVIGVPIFKENKIWGIILADNQTNRKEFTEVNLNFLNFFSNLVSLSLERIIKIEKLQKENLILINKLQSTENIPDMIGKSKPMVVLAKLIHKVANTDATVLITGESGTGKDLVAQAIHKLSPRKDKPFLAQFCGSIPDDLLQSELFGYKKGAFTGAYADKNGMLEVADNGTFFLDEIADISPALQAKLLRVLENKEIIRLGDTNSKKINVRIVAATNKDLQQLVKEGEFREDLFYRLNVFPIKLPPLRERKDDIVELSNYFIEKLGGKDKLIDTDALIKLEAYHWPGNVRQLINVLQRAVILCETNKISSEHIILEDSKERIKFDGTLRDFERQLLLSRLEESNGNRTHTANSLGVSVRWVQLKLKEMGIQ